MSGKEESFFMRCVMMHERAWGLQSYPKRPTLEQLLNARIVAFWCPTDEGMPFTATLHKDISEISRYLTHMVMNVKQQQPRLRLDRIFVNKRQVRVKGVIIQYEPVSE